MKVTDVSNVARVAAHAKPEPRVEKPGTDVPRVSTGKEPSTTPDEAVVISSGNEVAAEKTNYADQNTQRTQADHGAKEIGRDYSVDDGDVVVTVIDKEEDKILREIPPEEQRRIKEAIAQITQDNEAAKAENSDNTNAGDAKAGGVDVTL